MSTIDFENVFSQEFLQFLLKLRSPNGKNIYFHHVFELLEIGETERAVLVLSEILRGPRFSQKLDFWMERITFWIDSKMEHDSNAFIGFKLSPRRVLYYLTNIIAFDEELLHSILEPPVLK
jgi:hypothetical protein